MGHQLNIKSDHAYAVANKLSEMTGLSLTTVVTTALDQFLEREERARDRQAKIERIMALAAEIKAHMDPDATSDHSWIYDEDGFPK
jgi:antitoxin VapB